MKKVFILAASIFAVISPVAAQQSPVPHPSSAPPIRAASPVIGQNSVLPQVQGFNIVLLVGESQSSGASIDDVPPAARKALNDMRDFLPFKHYRVLDSQWTSCCGDGPSAQIRGNVQGVRGYGMAPDGSSVKLSPHTYSFLLHIGPTGAQRLSVMFRLEEPPSGGQNIASFVESREEMERRHAELRRELDTLADEIPRRLQRLGDKHPEVMTLQQQRSRVQQRLAESVNQLAHSTYDTRQGQGGRRSVIDSSFTMDLGETVVVGTSRLGGDKALIAIVTAVRRGTR